MSTDTSQRPVGPRVDNWAPPPAPTGTVLAGNHARLEPLSADSHAAGLFRAFAGHDAVWDYLPYGPFATEAQYRHWVRGVEGGTDPLFYAVQDLETGTWGGVASFLRVQPAAGSIEVGHINFAPSLQRTRAATEAMVLMMGWAFDAGYRRYEWKCNALNRASRLAAQRLGLSFEGLFRQAAIVKGRNRDTAWFAAIDSEWPGLAAAFRAWLAPSNFDRQGRQIERLSDLTAPVRAGSDPSL